MVLSVPAPPGRPAGLRLTSAIYGSDVTDSVNFLTNPPIFLGVQTVVQALTSGVWAAISLDTHSYDTYSGHSTVTNNSRYTAVVAGYYTVCGVVAFANNSTAARESALAVNSNRLAGTGALVAPSSGDGAAVPTPTRDIFLNVGDYVELHAIQDSGGGVNTKASGELASALWVRFSHA